MYTFKRYLFLIALSLIIVSCGNTYRISATHDKYDDFSSFRLTDNTVPNSGSRVDLNAMYVIRDSSDKLLRLFINYYSSDWLFIEEGNSLTFVADGEKIKLSGKGSSSYRDVRSGGNVRETAYYNISKENYKTLFSADLVEFKLSGSKVYLERKLNKRNKENMKRFYDEFVNHEDVNLNPTKYRSKGVSKTERKSLISSIGLITLLIIVFTGGS